MMPSACLGFFHAWLRVLMFCSLSSLPQLQDEIQSLTVQRVALHSSVTKLSGEVESLQKQLGIARSEARAGLGCRDRGWECEAAAARQQQTVPAAFAHAIPLRYPFSPNAGQQRHQGPGGRPGRGPGAALRAGCRHGALHASAGAARVPCCHRSSQLMHASCPPFLRRPRAARRARPLPPPSGRWRSCGRRATSCARHSTPPPPRHARIALKRKGGNRQACTPAVPGLTNRLPAMPLPSSSAAGGGERRVCVLPRRRREGGVQPAQPAGVGRGGARAAGGRPRRRGGARHRAAAAAGGGAGARHAQGRFGG